MFSVEQKLVQCIEGLHYDDRLKFLNLMRLETRRVRSDLIETFKIVNGKYSIKSESLFEYNEGGRRGHSKELLSVPLLYHSMGQIIKSVFFVCVCMYLWARLRSHYSTDLHDTW